MKIYLSPEQSYQVADTNDCPPHMLQAVLAPPSTMRWGKEVSFMLDTGSPDVVLPPEIATKLGIDVDSLETTTVSMFAMPSVQVKVTSVDLRFNPIPGGTPVAMQNVRVLVVEGTPPLIGRSVLRCLDIGFSGDRITRLVLSANGLQRLASERRPASSKTSVQS